MSFEDLAIDIAEDPGPIKVYIYGEPGAGKTIFACGAPKPLLIDADRGRRSLLNHPELLKKGIKILPGRDYDEVSKILFGIMDGDSFFDDIETIVIDTYSELQKRELSALIKAAHEDNKNRNPDVASEFEYNINNQRLRKLLLAFIEKTDKNLVLTGHIKEEKDAKGSVVLTRPDQSPGLTSSILALVDGVFYLSSSTTQVGVTTRTLRFLPSNALKGKNRFGPLPMELKNPTFDVILEADAKQRDVARKLRDEREKEKTAQTQQTQPESTEQTTSILNI